ncbi:MAG: hypothetical protein HQK51_01070 [Oligoflexia bacterium]|nr:hypothetical protein [Oligoflexia bacterium]
MGDVGQLNKNNTDNGSTYANNNEKAEGEIVSNFSISSVMNILKIITPGYVSQISSVIGGGEKILLTKALINEMSENFKNRTDLAKYKETLQEKENKLQNLKIEKNPIQKNASKGASTSINVLTTVEADAVASVVASATNDERISASEKNNDNQQKNDKNIQEIDEKESIDGQNVEVDNTPKENDMPDIFGNSIMNLLKVLSPTEISKLSKKVGGKKKVSITEMLTEQTQGNKLQTPKISKNKKKKENEEEEKKEAKKEQYNNNFKSRAEINEEVALNEILSTNNPSMKNKKKNNYNYKQASEYKNRNKMAGDMVDNNEGQEEEMLASTIFLLQEKEKIKKSQVKLKKMKVFDSYKNSKNIVKRNKDNDDKDDQDEFDNNDDHLNANDKEKKDKKQKTNQGILFDKNQR